MKGLIKKTKQHFEGMKDPRTQCPALRHSYAGMLAMIAVAMMFGLPSEEWRGEIRALRGKPGDPFHGHPCLEVFYSRERNEDAADCRTPRHNRTPPLSPLRGCGSSSGGRARPRSGTDVRTDDGSACDSSAATSAPSSIRTGTKTGASGALSRPSRACRRQVNTKPRTGHAAPRQH